VLILFDIYYLDIVAGINVMLVVIVFSNTI